MSDGQVVIITGGGKGIGYGIGRCFAAKGASIVIADIDEALGQKSAAELKAEGAADAVGIPCDVADRDSIQKMVDRTVAHFGRIDVLVNNAGICPFVDVMEITPETWQKTLDVDLTGPFHCTQIVGRQMIKQGGGGRVVCITSMADTHIGASQVDYAAAKSGLRMMVVGFCTALGKHGITVNAVAPGHICTDMTRHHWEKPGPAEHIKKRVPMGRIGQPEDIGHACVFLASKEAEYISGITIRVDGGFIALNN